MSEHIKRLKNEALELGVKLAKLHTFISDSPVFDGLDEAEKDDLIRQRYYMHRYLTTLNRRMERAA